jgi:hypothetical protein
MGITWQFTATGEGAGVGRMSSVFLFGSEERSQSSVLLRAGLGDDRLFSLSLPLCVADRQSGYVYVLAWFLLGHGFIVYSLFVVA